MGRLNCLIENFQKKKYFSHRYTVRDVSEYNHRVIDSRRGMIGLCYVLDPDLSLPRRQDVGYRNLVVARDAIGGKRLEPRGAFDDHAEWGACQVGAAAEFVRREVLGPSAGREQDGGDLAVFGAPGCFTWRGNLLAQSVGSMRRYDTAVDFENMRRFGKHGHMGLSVTSGRFFGGRMQYVSGAPHAGDGDDRKGQVYFFSRRFGEDGLTAEQVVQGEAFGAGFGYSLAALDANGDTSSDLLVGAPFHDGGKTGRGGAVYLYLSRRGDLQHDRAVRILGRQLESQFGLSLATLGDLNRDGFSDFAVGAPYEEGGGAVYVFLGGPSGLRSHGPSKSFLKAEEVADQVVRASELSSKIRVLPTVLSGFGVSLSGGMDMDDNGYPDLLVGAYGSEHVFLLRARPIIDISTFVDETNLKGIDPGRAGCPDDEDSEEACFGFSACFSVDREVSERGLGIRFEIEAEPQKPVSRVWLRLRNDGSDRGTREKKVTDSIRLRNHGGHQEERCTAVVGYVSSHADLQTPVQFAMSYSIIQEEPHMDYLGGRPLPNVDDYPILNQAQAKKKFQAYFEKDCGSDDICQSQLMLTPTLRDGSTQRELRRTPGGYYELELGSLAEARRGSNGELVLEVEVSNAGDPAYEAEMDVYFPSDVSYVGMGGDDDTRRLNSPDLRNDTWLSFRLGNPFKGVDDEGEPHMLSLQLRFSPSTDIREKLIQFVLVANTSSEQSVDPSTFVNLMIVRRAEVKVVGGGFPEEVHYSSGGEVRGESAMRVLGEIGPTLTHRFQVTNGGPSMVDVLTVEVDWPHQVQSGKPQGKWLLYLTEHPLLRNGRGDCFLPAGVSANPLNLTSSASAVKDGIIARHVSALREEEEEGKSVRDVSSSSEDDGSSDLSGGGGLKRTRREVEMVIPAQTVTGPDGSRTSVVRLDCDRGTAKCLRITCQIFALPAHSSATLVVRSRLWNSTLAEDYSDVDLVEVFAKAKIKVDDVVTQDKSDDYVGVRTAARPDVRRGPGGRLIGPDWWIVVVAVLAGLLLLVMISLCLWKLGFFERKRRPSSASAEEDEDDADFMMSAHFEKVRLNGSSAVDA